MKFKLKKTHIFLILLVVLLFSSLGFSVIEGMGHEDNSPKDSSTFKNTAEGSSESGSSVGRMGRRDRLKNAKIIHNYDPFNNDPRRQRDTPSEMTESSILDFLDNRNKQKQELNSASKKPLPIPKLKSKMSQGNDELYVLKSQIVPPICPKCPDVKKCDTNKDCPPCPAPKRCPPTPFECKMVPKFNDPRSSTHLPKPVLNSFDTFA